LLIQIDAHQDRGLGFGQEHAVVSEPGTATGGPDGIRQQFERHRRGRFVGQLVQNASGGKLDRVIPAFIYL